MKHLCPLPIKVFISSGVFAKLALSPGVLCSFNPTRRMWSPSRFNSLQTISYVVIVIHPRKNRTSHVACSHIEFSSSMVFGIFPKFSVLWPVPETSILCLHFYDSCTFSLPGNDIRSCMIHHRRSFESRDVCLNLPPIGL